MLPSPGSCTFQQLLSLEHSLVCSTKVCGAPLGGVSGLGGSSEEVAAPVHR